VHDRQQHRERGALACTRAVGANLSTVGVDEVPHDRETETHTAMLAGRLVIGLAK
jgi:hypothetical protein